MLFPCFFSLFSIYSLHLLSLKTFNVKKHESKPNIQFEHPNQIVLWLW